MSRLKSVSKSRNYKRSNSFTLSGWIHMSHISENFDAFKVYVVEISNDTERFIKIGRTFCSIDYRFNGNDVLPYRYKILYEVIDNPFRIFNLELKLKREFKDYKYTPLIKFSGCGECFNLECLETIKDYL